MARVLFAWELGAGLGHCANIRPLIEKFLDEGHDVHVALRDVCLANQAFGDSTVTLHQAPHQIVGAQDAIPVPCTFAHILHNTGFGSRDRLHCLVRAWRGLYHAAQPDLILFEHSPTALLASYTIDVPRVLVGTGFCCPCDESPLPNLRPWEKVAPADLREDEYRVNAHVSAVMERYRKPGWQQLSQMFSSVDFNALLTFQELDHYANRTDAAYFGSWPLQGGERDFHWPKGRGDRVFCYLKSFPALPNLISLLRDLRTSTLVYAPDLARDAKSGLSRANVRFIDERLNLDSVAQECDLAILNGNLSSTTTFLLRGVPSFHVPLFLEQAIFARRLVDYGAGLAADPDRPERIGARLATMIRDSRFAEKAGEFSNQHASFCVDQSISEAYSNIRSLIS